MTIGLQLGICNPVCFMSQAQLLAAGLPDGTLWTLYGPTGALVDSGIWPQLPRGATPGGCAGPCVVVVGDPDNFRYGLALDRPPLVLEECELIVISSAAPPP